MALQDLPASFFQRPLRLRPHFSPRPWGGDRLAAFLGKELPEAQRGKAVGESWELSDHPDGRSTVVSSDPNANGATFGDLLRARPMEMVGTEQLPARYPLLVKYLDASGDLSVQVHPDDAWCIKTGHDDRGKSECWYIIDCPPGSKIIHGYKPGVTEEKARLALAEGKLRDVLNFVPVKPGDFVPVVPGTVHAMLTGLLVCEIQQSSNTTFRLYDWDRLPARELHIESSMQVTDFQMEHAIQSLGAPGAAEGVRNLLENDYFSVRMHDLTPRQPAKLEIADAHGAILNVVGGSGRVFGRDWMEELALGDTLFLPAAMGSEVEVEAGIQGLRLLRTVSRELGVVQPPG